MVPFQTGESGRDCRRLWLHNIGPASEAANEVGLVDITAAASTRPYRALFEELLLIVNPMKAKLLTNIRAAGSEENIILTPLFYTRGVRP